MAAMIPLDKLRAVKTLYTHANCPDGVASALIVKDALPDVRVSFVKYGSEEHKNLVPTPGTLFCDFSPFKDRWEGELHAAQPWIDAGVIVLDHHTRDVVEPYGELGVFGENERLECGAWLAYEHVWLPLQWDAVRRGQNPHYRDHFAQGVHDFALRAAVRDTWRQDDERFKRAREEGELLLFWGMKQPLDYYLGLSDEGRGALAERLFERAEEHARKGISESHRFTSGKGTRVLMFQGVSATSDAAELLDKTVDEMPGAARARERVDLVVGFHYRHETCSSCGGGGDNDPSGEHGLDPACPHCRGLGGRLQLQFSTRSHTGFDCQAFARAHGGNGHRAAAGFTVTPRSTLDPYEMFRMILNDWEEGR